MRKPLVLFLFLLQALVSVAQSVSNLNTGRIVELEAIQTPSGRLISASMLRDDVSAIREESILLHRSDDLGASWTHIQTFRNDDNTADPVLAIDSMGTLYLMFMTVKLPAAIDLELYTSQDDGLSWQLKGFPNLNNGWADYPQLIARGDGELFLSYSRFFLDNSALLGQVVFKKSSDGGSTWSQEKIFKLDSHKPIGPDLVMGSGDSLLLAFGEGLSPHIHLVESGDAGTTWSPLQVIDLLEGDHVGNVAKPLANANVKGAGILVHAPHLTNTPISLLHRPTSTSFWDSTFIGHGAYAQGVVDDDGRFHVIFNQQKDSLFLLNYIISEDSGQTFGPPLVLYSARFEAAELGEYQSMMIGQDDRLYVTFCDWADSSRAKLLVYPGAMTSVEQEAFAKPLVYPNPTSGKISVDLSGLIAPRMISVVDHAGRLIMQEPIHDFSHWETDLTALPDGIYLLRVEEENRILIWKVKKVQKN